MLAEEDPCPVFHQEDVKLQNKVFTVRPRHTRMFQYLCGGTFPELSVAHRTHSNSFLSLFEICCGGGLGFFGFFLFNYASIFHGWLISFSGLEHHNVLYFPQDSLFHPTLFVSCQPGIHLCKLGVLQRAF